MNASISIENGQGRVSTESLKVAEHLLKTDGVGLFIGKQKEILAEILDEINFSATIRSKVDEIENRKGTKYLVLQGLKKKAQKNGWLSEV